MKITFLSMALPPSLHRWPQRSISREGRFRGLFFLLFSILCLTLNDKLPNPFVWKDTAVERSNR